MNSSPAQDPWAGMEPKASCRPRSVISSLRSRQRRWRQEFPAGPCSGCPSPTYSSREGPGGIPCWSRRSRDKPRWSRSSRRKIVDVDDDEKDDDKNAQKEKPDQPEIERPPVGDLPLGPGHGLVICPDVPDILQGEDIENVLPHVVKVFLEAADLLVVEPADGGVGPCGLDNMLPRAHFIMGRGNLQQKE